jgi:hypothetical protein
MIRGRTGGGTVPGRRDEVVKHANQGNAVRLDAVRSSDGLEGIRAWREARGIAREWLDWAFGKNVRVGEAVSATGCQDRDDGGVQLLVCHRRPVERELETICERR